MAHRRLREADTRRRPRDMTLGEQRAQCDEGKDARFVRGSVDAETVLRGLGAGA